MKEKVLENRVTLRLNNDGTKKCPWGIGTTQEGNNPSNQGAIHHREVTFEALCKMLPCFCLPLFTTELMKRKDDKYVYKKRTNSIIHHLAGVQYNYYKRNLFSYPLTMNGHLRRKYSSEHCPRGHVFQNCPQHAIQASTQVALPLQLALLFLYLPPFLPPHTKHAGDHPKFCFAATMKTH